MIRGIAVVSAALFAAAAAHGAGGLFGRDDPVKITVQAGAGGWVRTGSPAAVQVILENQTDLEEKEFEGRVVVGFSAFGRVPVRARRSVALAPGASKSVFVYVPCPEFADEVVVRYETMSGKRIAELRETVRPIGAETPVLGVVGEMPDGLPETLVDGAERYVTLFLRPEELPDRSEGLSMFDAILVTPPPRGAIAGDRVRALREWVLRGGVLVADVSRRTQVFATGRFGDLLPLFPRSVEQKHLSVFDTETLFTSGTVRGGKVLLESDGHPLVVRRPLGLGAVTCFAFDPHWPVFVEWSGREALWASVLDTIDFDAAPARPPGGFQADPVVRLGQMVAQAPSTGLRLILVLALTALYALVIGPVDYWFVRRLRRPNLTWFTFPALVAAFTVASHVGARVWIGGETHARNAQRILVFPEAQSALQFDTMGLFVSRGDDYRLELAGGGRLRYHALGWGREDRMDIDHDAETLTQRIPIWTHRLYTSSRVTETGPAVEVSLGRDADGGAVTISNRADFVLRDNYVVWGNPLRHVALSPIRPGQSATVSDGADTVQRGPPPLGGNVTLAGFSAPGAAAGPGRELSLLRALDRGGVVFLSLSAGEAGCPLVVDGRPRPERGQRMLEILTYEGGPR